MVKLLTALTSLYRSGGMLQLKSSKTIPLEDSPDHTYRPVYLAYLVLSQSNALVSSNLNDSQSMQSRMGGVASLQPPVRPPALPRTRDLVLSRNQRLGPPSPIRLSNPLSIASGSISIRRQDRSALDRSQNNSGIIASSRRRSEEDSQMERGDSISHPQDVSHFDLNSSQEYSRDISRAIDDRFADHMRPSHHHDNYSHFVEDMNIGPGYASHRIGYASPVELSGYQEVEMDNSGLHSRGLE